MRILPVRTDHDRGRTPRQQIQTDRCRNRHRDARQHLPLRHLPGDSRSDSSRRAGRCPMSAIEKLNRRSFLKVSTAATGGLLIGVYLPGKGELAAQAGSAPVAAQLNAFVHIGTDDLVTFIIHKPENGQGTTTSLSQLLAEELECDWKKIRWEYAPIAQVYASGGLQGTVGSQAIRTTYNPLRQAGAVGRELLLQAAAQQWGVDKAQCKAENSTVINTATNAKLSYGSLAEA